MNDRFRDKVALVSGAAQGIGLGVVRRLLEEGARVVAVDRSELVHELAGDACLCLTADLERYAECQRVLERTLERFGRLDILVNNVGGTLWAKPYQHYAEDEIEAELRRSLLPTLWCCRAALPAMLGQGSGAPGTILEASRDGLLVACGEGALRLTRLQLPGGKPLAFADLYNSRREQFAAGQVLGQ